MFVFAPLSLTRVSGVDDNFINKPRLVQDETNRRTKTCKHCCGDQKSGTADTMVSQKSGPALAGPAGPAAPLTTALLGVDKSVNLGHLLILTQMF